MGLTNVEQSPFRGHAIMLKPTGAPVADYDTLAKQETELTTNPNQPIVDDGQLTPNETGLSEAAEVCYFLRGNTLYRRVLLIRQPYGNTPLFNEAGASILPPGEDYSISHVAVPTPTAIGAFWNDFDYSATYRTGTNTGPIFHNWQNAKDNKASAASLNNSTSLGFPHLRFGHSPNRSDGTPLDKIGTGASLKFIGRFTQRETAHANFGFPGKIPAGGDPHTTAVADNLTLSANNEVEQFSTSTGRRGEDIIMENVFEFDIKVWDDGLSSPTFVDLGNGDVNGFYGQKTNSASTYGNRYDTWHPDFPGTTPSFRAPYRPVTNGPDGQPGEAGVDDDGINGIDDAGELGYPGTDDEHPLKAIQITIRFFDKQSQQTRQLTIIEALSN
ncbi:hypothetical protein MNBD_PLANCTO02-1976 [hydrothermal vent metagenome]|uniref:Uncharacterized protein n=1 Tax=hydrothermal vent metagenome TaxID=652676 RepID=A0A3B1D0S3_9ZZZZ